MKKFTIALFYVSFMIMISCNSSKKEKDATTKNDNLTNIERWKLIPDGYLGDQYIDTKSIVFYNNKTEVEIWIKVILDETGKKETCDFFKDEKFNDIHHILSLTRYDIKHRLYNLKEANYYDSNNKFIHKEEFTGWKSISPNSYRERNFDAINEIISNY